MVETSMRHHWWNTQTSTSGGSYSRICRITWRGSAPAASAEVASLVSWSSAFCSNSSASDAALRDQQGQLWREIGLCRVGQVVAIDD